MAGNSRRDAADRPDPIRFHDALAQGWASRYRTGGFLRRLQVFRGLLERHVQAGQSWLDLGCGSGVLTRELLSKGARVVAVDASGAMLGRAEEDCAEFGAQVQWLQADVRDLGGLRPGSFDGVLCSSVVEYLPEAGPLIREAARLLGPGGRLVISIPPRWSIIRTSQKILRWAGRHFGIRSGEYLSVSMLELSSPEVWALLRDAGFDRVESARFDPVMPRCLATILRPALVIYVCSKSSGDCGVIAR